MNALLPLAKVTQTIEQWLSDYLNQSGCKGFVIALSGGIDSSVTAVLCRRVTRNTRGLLLPCGETPADAAPDALLLAKQFDIETTTYDLTPVFNAFLTTLGVTEETADPIVVGNIKARLRMVTLYFEANLHQRLVVGTGNRTELALGYFTKYGDGGVDLLPLGNLLKREVRDLAEFHRIPDRIIQKPPTAGFFLEQTDEKELGATYDQLDDFVSGVTPKGLSPARIEELHQRLRANEHKIKLPPICPVHS
ncbi:MAG: NAD(+) synthase [Promethearchaeota archaeon]